MNVFFEGCNRLALFFLILFFCCILYGIFSLSFPNYRPFLPKLLRASFGPLSVPTRLRRFLLFPTDHDLSYLTWLESPSFPFRGVDPVRSNASIPHFPFCFARIPLLFLSFFLFTSTPRLLFLRCIFLRCRTSFFPGRTVPLARG